MIKYIEIQQAGMYPSRIMNPAKAHRRVLSGTLRPITQHRVAEPGPS